MKLNSFFRFLNEKFNGVLFKDTDITLSQLQAYSLSLIFDGSKNKVEPTLFDNLLEFYFDVFDFSIIPVEIISGIYESLINEETREEHSAVYTPSFLVEYILAETVDKHLLNNSTAECKVFDPSCGSGIFIVQSYRRMVDKELALNNGKVTKTRLREIAQNNLFGVDLNEQALKVTCFSIYIAILDYQDPKTIVDNFKFPKLIDENLFSGDFFDTNHPFNEIVKSKNQDFILGNPPWKSNKGDKHLAWLKENKKVTGRFEIAQSFLLRSKDFMHPNTVSALIITSTIFYNISDNTKAFKKEFLTTYCLDKFFDLSPVRRLVFEEKNSPAAIVYYRLSDDNKHLSNIVKHISIKSNIFLKYFKTLIIEKFDQKEIQQKNSWKMTGCLRWHFMEIL
ncbi:Eco57I restriction-modification methylase domain-containing protein [Mucilaginibacter sp. P19]|uniref:Eco57I restriction-modification methylase domain-containing protein n=1 Tax=Mucilaginibacter sp. P19 TaxID=3423947 RepID=UPI003D67C68F